MMNCHGAAVALNAATQLTPHLSATPCLLRTRRQNCQCGQCSRQTFCVLISVYAHWRLALFSTPLGRCEHFSAAHKGCAQK